jgi:hypothetical protein
MHRTVESIKSAAPPAGATLLGWPWWAVAILLIASCGSSWVMAWLDVVDRLRARSTPDAADGPEQSPHTDSNAAPSSRV